MIDDGSDCGDLIDEPEFNLPPPLFDQRAAANAQPVQPIPDGSLSAFRNHISCFVRALTRGSRALVLVVIAELGTGMLVGMSWVRERPATAVWSAANEPGSEVSSPDSQNEEPLASVDGIIDSSGTSPRSSQIRKARLQARSIRAPRAYRVAVLR